MPPQMSGYTCGKRPPCNPYRPAHMAGQPEAPQHSHFAFDNRLRYRQP
jgi:hypothetical protein